MSGRFFVVEGLDGAGTTTQSKLLEVWLRERAPVLLTREPTDGPVGRIIRRVLSGDDDAPDWRTLPWMFAADRADHLFSEIQPALDAGTHVVSDRYYHSSLAYQSLTLPLDKVASLNDFRAPDLTVYIELSVDVCLARINARGEAKEIFEKRDKLQRIADAYRQVIDFLRQRGDRIQVVDGDQPIEAVFGEVRSLVEARL